MGYVYVTTKECYLTKRPMGFIGVVCLHKSHGDKNKYSTIQKEKYYEYVLGDKFIKVQTEDNSRPSVLRISNVSTKPINFRGTPVELYKKLNYYRNKREDELKNSYDDALHKIKTKRDLDSYEILLRSKNDFK